MDGFTFKHKGNVKSVQNLLQNYKKPPAPPRHTAASGFQANYPQGELYEVIEVNDNDTYDLAKYSAYTYTYSPSGLSGGSNFGADLWLPEGQGTNYGARLDSVVSILPGRKNKLVQGDMVEVCFYDRNRQRPYIKRLLKRGFYQFDAGFTPSVTVALGLWYQSNQESHQNVLGNYVLLTNTPFLGSNDTWKLPTVNVEGLYENTSIAFGLARVEQEEFNHTNTPVLPEIHQYISCWPVRRDGTFLCDLAFGGWGITSRTLEWRKDFELGISWPISSTIRNEIKFAYSGYGRWVHCLIHPDLESSIMFSAKQDTDTVTFNNLSTTFTKPAYNMSFYGYEASGYALSKLILPYTDANSPGTYQDIQFWQQDIEGDGSWTLENEFNVQTTVMGDSNYLTIQNGHAGSGPVPWFNRYVYLFCSGKKADNTSIKWVISSLKTDGTAGQNAGIATDATAAPEALSEGMLFNTEVLAAPYSTSGYSFSPGLPLTPSPRWMIETAILGTPSESYATWENTAIIQLPAETQNTERFGTLASASAAAWPLAAKNSLGGACIDGTMYWTCFLQPVQKKAGGHYEPVITENALQTYRVYQTQRFYPLTTISNDAYSLDTGASVLLGYTGTVGETVRVYYNPGPYADGDLVYIDIFVEDVGLKPKEEGKWVNDQVFLWETKIVGLNLLNGNVYFTNISQDFTVGLNVSFGKEGGVSSTTQTADNVPHADNVWKLISLPGKSCLAVLRDLHADDPDGNPSVHLEIWSYASGYGDLTKIATVPLGSQDLFVDGVGDTYTGTTNMSLSYQDSFEDNGITFTLITGDEITGVNSVYLNGNPDTELSFTFSSPNEVTLDSPISPGEYILINFSYTYDAPLPGEHLYGDRIWDPYTVSPPRMKACGKITDTDTSNPILKIAIYEEKKIDTGTQEGFRRAVFHTVNLETPATPITTTEIVTSLGVGIGDISNPTTNGPLWFDWDSLVMCGSTMTWLKNSQFFENV